MHEGFIYSLDNKRYHTLNYHLKKTFGRKIYKAVIDGGFTCPNIDGTKGRGGCIFCDGGSGYFTHPGMSVTQQLETEYRRISAKYGEVPVTAYFQANTNTYAPVERLHELYFQAINFPHTVGLSIGTRADCISDEVLELLKDINKMTYLTVELGMQTVHEKSISAINRCCTNEEFLTGCERLKSNNIRVCLHIINGLPGETAHMMTETARQAADLRPDAVKIQMLHIIRGTALAERYNRSPFHLLTMEEYIDTVIRQLEVLPPETVIERITGDGDRKKLIAPLWTANKIAVLGAIDKRMKELDTHQGKRLTMHNA
ncbi:MAG: TIGR01212 family radical SAM protein [Ruminococcus sp.]|nr:TIGR01212 family radical SAM protein [Ruminococcus sp.]